MWLCLCLICMPGCDISLLISAVKSSLFVRVMILSHNRHVRSHVWEESDNSDPWLLSLKHIELKQRNSKSVIQIKLCNQEWSSICPEVFIQQIEFNLKSRWITGGLDWCNTTCHHKATDLTPLSLQLPVCGLGEWSHSEIWSNQCSFLFLFPSVNLRSQDFSTSAAQLACDSVTVLRL